MPEDVSAERVQIIAAAARIPLDPSSPQRIANSARHTAARFAAEEIALPLEAEPATFAAVARQDSAR